MTSVPKAIQKIFWGLFIVLIDIHIVIIDLLPDFIGYLFVVSGLSQLQTYASPFSKAKKFSLFLALLSLATIFQGPPIPLDEFILNKTSILMMGISTFHGLLHLSLVFYIMNGCLEIAEKEHYFTFITSAKKGIMIYLIGTIAYYTVLPLVLNVQESTAFYIIGFNAITSIILEIMILVLLRQFKNRVLQEAASL